MVTLTQIVNHLLFCACVTQLLTSGISNAFSLYHVNPNHVYSAPSSSYGNEEALPVYRDSYGSTSGSVGGDGKVIQAAVIRRHQIHYYDVPIESSTITPTTIEVGVQSVPINILLRSASSRLNVRQVHESATGSYQETESEDEPHSLKHTVKKPIIQEVYELITPYRFIRQEIKPVQEIIETIVARQAAKESTQNAYLPVQQQPEVHLPQQPHLVEQVAYRIEPEPAYSEKVVHVNPVKKISTKSKKRLVEEEELRERLEQDYLAAASNAIFTNLYGIPAIAASTSF